MGPNFTWGVTKRSTWCLHMESLHHEDSSFSISSTCQIYLWRSFFCKKWSIENAWIFNLIGPWIFENRMETTNVTSTWIRDKFPSYWIFKKLPYIMSLSDELNHRNPYLQDDEGSPIVLLMLEMMNLMLNIGTKFSNSKYMSTYLL
jgi:hypothetical protein